MRPFALVLSLALARLPSAASSRRGLAACSCDCCVAEPRREAAVDEDEGWDCVLAQPGLRFDSSPFYAQPSPCGSLCLQAPGDEVFTSTETPEVDAQHYCFVACAPKGGGQRLPQQGGLCQHLPSAASAALRAATQRARPTAAPPLPAAAHFLLHDSAHAAAVAGRASASAVGSATAASGRALTSSAKDPASDKDMLKLAERAREIKRRYTEVADGEVAEIEKFSTRALEAVATAEAAASGAEQAARSAEEAERRVRGVLKNVRRLARAEALRAIPEVLDPLVKKAHQESAREAHKQAEMLEKERFLEAPRAAQRAAAPYKEAMLRAAEEAANYAERGRVYADRAQVLQMEAQAFQRHANLQSSQGNTAEAQRLMLRARALAEQAAYESSAADTDYRNSQSISEINVPEYARLASQAAHHAQVTVDPNTGPPLPPIV
uniref:Uncharacterized protein n=2 Tax=Alexandrium monilatum TaxID=311494 RepID=A0A7S4RDU7_9DINO